MRVRKSEKVRESLQLKKRTILKLVFLSESKVAKNAFQKKNSVAEQNESNGKLKPNFKFLCLSERFLAVDASEVRVSS